MCICPGHAKSGMMSAAEAGHIPTIDHAIKQATGSDKKMTLKQCLTTVEKAGQYWGLETAKQDDLEEQGLFNIFADFDPSTSGQANAKKFQHKMRNALTEQEWKVFMDLAEVDEKGNFDYYNFILQLQESKPSTIPPVAREVQVRADEEDAEFNDEDEESESSIDDIDFGDAPL